MLLLNFQIEKFFPYIRDAAMDTEGWTFLEAISVEVTHETELREFVETDDGIFLIQFDWYTSTNPVDSMDESLLRMLK